MEADEQIIEFLREELRSIKPALPRDWPLAAHFKQDLNLDSLDLVELVARIEQRYELMIPDADLPGFTSLEALHAYIVERVSA
ncbi:acyl carrier protein [Rivibacter subsaxonicus]|uniref:Acyl carrier protein AcpXL n=1 Tax=Rivibacter subsaxonicus TaxID=457575 RepID=A0A4Q7VGD8_9BURK|nr:acyl carrier protein [Rivibacter subsaxonicus]RZT95092.1 acyl carrier protein [Rivibacter subsaxonicus]